MSESHPMRVCGLKLTTCVSAWCIFVTPYAGVWIETSSMLSRFAMIASHPMRVCGLKHKTMKAGIMAARKSHPMRVCGLKPCKEGDYFTRTGSHPMRVCGLKLHIFIFKITGHLSHPMRVCGLKQSPA